jgi:ribosome maturation factor RimP
MNVYQTQLEGKLFEMLEPALTNMGFEIIRIKIGGGSKYKNLQIMLDRADGTMLTVGDCEQVSRHTSVLLDVEDPIEQEYTLEVSSAGLNRPLTRKKDFENYCGNGAKVTLKIAKNGQRNFTGTVSKANEDSFSFTEKDTSEVHEIPYANVADAHLLFEEKKNTKNKPKNRRK